MKALIRILILFFSITLVALPAWGKVTVTRDQYGIPRIQADAEQELFEEFGYVVAVDRLWQMEVNKRWGLGALAEVFGPKLIPADMQTRLIGYSNEEYQTIFEKLSLEYQKFLVAYLKGVNRRVDEVLKDPRLLPMEYLVLKFKPQHFTVVDSLAFTTALLRKFGMIGGGELRNFTALQSLTSRLGKKEGWATFNDWCWINDPSAPTYIQEKIGGNFIPESTIVSEIPSYLRGTHEVEKLAHEEEHLSALAQAEALRVGAPIKMGSYAWTLSPQVTGTGYPVLVGQPQIGLEGNVPFVIMEVHLKGGRFNVAGMSFPLLPLVPIGHNRYLAWSHMVGMCDNVDIYQEVLNPLNREEYLFQGVWRKMSKRIEKIAVAAGEAKEFPIYYTIHGPIFSPFPFDPQTAKADQVYSKKLAHWKKEALSPDAWLQMMRAKNVQEFGKGVVRIMTSLHTVYADIQGNIGYWHTGLNPERPEGFDPRLPLPGTGEAEWTGKYLPNAHVLNPPKGFVSGWNNKASPDTRNPFSEDPNYQAYGRYSRAIWLERALTGQKGLDLAKNKEIMQFVGGAGTWKYNHHNAFGGACKDILPFMAKSLAKAKDDEKPILNKVLAILDSWDGRSVNDVIADDRFQAGQTIFLDWLPRMLKATFGDEFDGIENFSEPIHNSIFNLFLRCLDGPISTLPVSRNYFDNINTPQEETMDDIFLQTLRETVAHLKDEFKSEDPTTWKAPRAKIIFRHSLFGQLADMWDNNVGGYIMIVELRPKGAIGYSRWPMGESANITMGPDKKPVFDPHFFDMLPLFKGYNYRKMGLD
jgi:penicillin amidase